MTQPNNQLKPLKDLNLTDRFLFDEVMEDPQTQQDALSIIFGREIPLLEQNAIEKELRISPLARSIRLDVFSVDEEHTVYNTEMQQKRKNDLAKRSRYYQALVDTSLLEPGIPNYNLLNQSYIIMLMPFDLFGHKKYRYTFRSVCEEVPDCVLEDGAVRIFLNTRGKNPEEVSPELVEFLYYLEHTTDSVAKQTNSEYIKRIHNHVCKVKANEEVGIKYMQAWEERYYDREEAREEGFKIGLEEGRQKGRTEGRREGRAEGRREGRAEGRAEGREESKKVFKLYMQGKTVEEIAEICDASIEKVKSILE